MLNIAQSRRVAVIGYNRIPFARQNTAYTMASNKDMMTAALNGLITRCKLDGQLLGEVAGGAVLKSSADLNLMRECVLSTSLNPATPTCDLQQACDTGIESAIYIANKIALRQIEVGIAGGVDSTSQVPLLFGQKLTQILLAARRAKSFGARVGQILKMRPKYWAPEPPQNVEPRTGLSMGGHTEFTAKHYAISRQEQDQFAFDSHIKMARAYDEGFFADMITPYLGLEVDNNLRRDTSLEKLASLKPAFDPVNGTLTAGNSTPLTDGASCILLASETWAREHFLPIYAYISFAEVAAIEYVNDKHNLLMAPVYATNRILKKCGLRLQDFDYYEIHEAFAAQVLATLKIFETPELIKPFGFTSLGKIDRAKLNVKGSSLAAAHPFAATGGRIIATMAKLLNQKGEGSKGFISICAAGGQGVTMIMEK